MQATASSTATQSGASDSHAGTSKAMQMLEEGIAKITDSESFKSYLSLSRSLHRYSARNMLLVYLQHPGTSRIAGYKRWKALGRQVSKGAKAIKILAPVSRKQTDEETGEEIRRVVGFRDASVFDITQTVRMDGAQEPTLPEVGDVVGSEDAAKELYDLLTRICEAEDVPIVEKDLPEGYYGSYDRGASYIVISSRLSQLDRATTLSHELAHHLLYPLYDGVQQSHATKETEAEGASFAICDAYGIDTSGFSFPYIVSHAGDSEVLAAALDRVQKVVHRVLSEAESDRQARAA